MVLPTSALPVKAIFRTRWMGDERRSGAGTVAGDDVDHARRQPHRLEVLGQLEDRKRGLLGRLEDDGAPGRERRRDLPGRHHDRVVPGDDLARPRPIGSRMAKATASAGTGSTSPLILVARPP